MIKKNLGTIISAILFIVLVFVSRQYSHKLEKQSYDQTINKYNSSINKN